MYRAAVEAFVKEACPDRLDKVNDMMVEYEGREDSLIGELSTMLAAKHGSTIIEGGTDTSSSGEYSSDDGASLSSHGIGSSSDDRVSDGSPSADENRYHIAPDSANQCVLDTNDDKSSQTSDTPPEDQGVNAGAVAGGVALAAAGAASVGAAAFYASRSAGIDEEESNNSVNHYDSSSVGSSEWSTSDEISSVDTDTFNSSSSDVMLLLGTSSSMVAAIEAASEVTERVSASHCNNNKG